MSVSLSVVVPVFNEVENLEPLLCEVREVLGEERTWEIVLVDDGSDDGTLERARELAAAEERLRVVPLSRRYGQSAALQAGFDAARGEVIVTMDGDLQNDPRDIPRLLAELEAGFDLVAGYRERRQDAYWTRTLPSRAANRLIRWITGVPIRDNGCSLRAFRRELLEQVHLYSDLHRFFSPLAVAMAGATLTELPVHHRPRVRGRSKYGLARIWKVAFDLLTVTTIQRFRERPLALFVSAAVAAVGLALGFLAAALLLQGSAPPAAARALVFPAVALLLLALACYLLMLGLIAEVALRGSRERDRGELPVLVEKLS